MTREEALQALSRRAKDRNLFFSFKGVAPTVETNEDYDGEFAAFTQYFGGFKTINDYGQRVGIEKWVIYDEQCETLTKELMERRDFQLSGKYEYASQMLATTIPQRAKWGRHR